MSSRLRVCIVGSGNFASAIARNVATNTKIRNDIFNEEVLMWVFEEKIKRDNGEEQNLSEIINTEHENVKYLSGVKLPENLKAETQLTNTVKGADVIIFCLPHQFIEKACREIREFVSPKAFAVSLIKGLQTYPPDSGKKGFRLISDMISEELGIPCSVMMGANLANEIAKEEFCESTLACKDVQQGHYLKMLFENRNFRVTVGRDTDTVEMCGALKNIVGFAIGLVDGMDMGEPTKTAVIRHGLSEMIEFVKMFNQNAQDRTFLQSCGLADLVTTCYGGRNRMVGEAFAKEKTKSLQQLEAELLNGQKLQGPMTAIEAAQIILEQKAQERFPLFMSVDKISRGEIEPEAMIPALRAASN